MKKWVDARMELYKAESYVGKGSVVIAEIYLALWVSVSFPMGSHQVQLILHRLSLSYIVSNWSKICLILS